MKPPTRSRVLIVDDSPIVRERLMALLAELPRTEVIGEAEAAFDPIRAVRRYQPAAVVLDISMPGASGMNVLQAIKQEQPAPLVIMLTNSAHEPYRARCFALGADYFFDKSTEFEKLIEVLRKLPGARRRGRRRRGPPLPV